MLHGKGKRLGLRNYAFQSDSLILSVLLSDLTEAANVPNITASCFEY
jgi:hypothetical protein